jgi:hypothetical protein
MAGGEQQGKPAADAKADDPDPARAVVPGGQPAAHCFHVLKRAALAGPQVVTKGAQASQCPAPGKQVWRSREVALAGQPVGLVAQVLAHAHGVMDDHHSPPRPLARRGREAGGHRPASGRDRHVGHHASSRGAASPGRRGLAA